MNDGPIARDLNLSHVGKRTAYKLGFRAGLAMADPLTDPRVVALVEALEMAVLWLDYDGRYDTLGMKAALAALEADT